MCLLAVKEGDLNWTSILSSVLTAWVPYDRTQAKGGYLITLVLIGPWAANLTERSSEGSFPWFPEYSFVLNESLTSSRQCISSYVCEHEKITWKRKDEFVMRKWTFQDNWPTVVLFYWYIIRPVQTMIPQLQYSNAVRNYNFGMFWFGNFWWRKRRLKTKKKLLFIANQSSIGELHEIMQHTHECWWFEKSYQWVFAASSTSHCLTAWLKQNAIDRKTTVFNS